MKRILKYLLIAILIGLFIVIGLPYMSFVAVVFAALLLLMAIVALFVELLKWLFKPSNY